MKLYDSSVSAITENGHTIKLRTLAVSKLLENVFIYLLGAVNSAMLSGYSADAVAAANLSNQIINLATTLLNMIITGSVICMSMSFGRDDRRASADIAGTAVIMTTLVSIAIGGFIIIFAEPLLKLLNVEIRIMDMAKGYLNVAAAFFAVTMLMSCINNFLICNGYAAYTMLVGVIYNFLNVVFCYIVLYTPINLPVPTVTAVAYAGRFACVVGLIVSSVIFTAKKCPFRFTFAVSKLKPILRIGVPGGMNIFSYNLAQSFTTGFIASLGVETFTAKVYISSVILFSNTISYAVGNSGAILMGRYRGMGDFDSIEKLYRQNFVLAILGNIAVSGAVFLLHAPLIGIFTNSKDVIALAGRIMLIDILVQICRGINNVSDHALNANGDVRATLVISAISCWTFSVVLSYVLGIKLGMGLIGIWIAFLLDEGSKALLHVLRWRSGKWKHINC